MPKWCARSLSCKRLALCQQQGQTVMLVSKWCVCSLPCKRLALRQQQRLCRRGLRRLRSVSLARASALASCVCHAPVLRMWTTHGGGWQCLYQRRPSVRTAQHLGQAVTDASVSCAVLEPSGSASYSQPRLLTGPPPCPSLGRMAGLLIIRSGDGNLLFQASFRSFLLSFC